MGLLLPLPLSVIIGGIVISESIAQYCVKKSKLPNCFHYFMFGIMAYAAVCLLLYYSYDYKPMGIVNAVWSAASIIAIIMVGSYFYHETLYAEDYIGVLLVIAGIFLIFAYGHT